MRQLLRVMPQEHIVYFGDTGRVPYGSRGPETVLKYTKQDIAFIKGFEIKAIVVACGTASSVALPALEKQETIPVIGVVEPACRRAAALTENRRIGIIGTERTIKSRSYEVMLKSLLPQAELYTRACPLFVPLVENGRTEPGDRVLELIIEEYLSDLRASGVDTLILGCTHYPLLKKPIDRFFEGSCALIDPGAEAADYAQTVLIPADGTRAGAEYYVSDDTESFARYASMYLGRGAEASLVDIASY